MSVDPLADFPLVPAGEEVTPELDLAAAAASALDAQDAAVLPDAAPIPFGRTPLFDFETGRMVRAGGDPVWVTGLAAVEQWCLMAAHSARYAHSVFTAAFGMEEPDSPIGEVTLIAEETSDWGERLAEALLVHDRVIAVDAVELRAEDDALYIDGFEVVTDEEDRLAIGPLTVALGGDGG